MAENASFDVLMDKIRPAVFAVGDDKKRGRKGKERKGKRREGKGRYTKSQDVILIFSGICGADTPRPIFIKFGMRVASRNIINMSIFAIKFSGVSDPQGVKISVFPLTLLVIVITVL